MQLPIRCKENDLASLRPLLLEQERLAAKYALSRALDKPKPGVVEWREKQEDGEKMLRLKISKDGKIKYLESPERMVEKEIDPAALQELITWMKELNQKSPRPPERPLKRGEVSFRFPIFQSDTRISIVETEMNVAGGSQTTFQQWSPHDGGNGGKDSSYEEIKARLLKLVK